MKALAHVLTIVGIALLLAVPSAADPPPVRYMDSVRCTLLHN